MSASLEPPHTPADVESLNDQLAREHPIDAYYDDSPWIVRWIEQRRLAIIREMVGPCDGLQILEVGSGGGHVLRMFPQAKLTALDVSEEFLKTAKKNLAGLDVEFIKGEIKELGLPAKSFDRVICTEVLEHTTNPSEVLAEIRSVLRPNGIAVITIPVDPLIDGLKKTVRFTPVGWALKGRINWGGDHYHFHKWWPWEFSKLLKEHFRIEQRSAAPFDRLPLRACFKCVPR